MNPAHDNQNSAFEDELEKAEEAHFKNCPTAEFSLRLASTTVDLILTYLAISALKNITKALTVFLSHANDYVGAHSLFSHLAYLIAHHSVQMTLAIGVSLQLLFVYAYFVISTSFSGGTPGKLLLGLRVLNYRSGKKLTPSKSLLRFVTATVSGFLSCGILYLWIPLNKENRGHHDVITDSCVKKVHGVR